MAKMRKTCVITPQNDSNRGMDRILDIPCPFCSKVTSNVYLGYNSGRRLHRELKNCGHTIIIGPQYLLPWLNDTFPQKRYSSILATTDLSNIIILDWISRNLFPWFDYYTNYQNRHLGNNLCFELFIDRDFDGAPAVNIQSVWIYLPSEEIHESFGNEYKGTGEFEWGEPAILSEEEVSMSGASKLSEVFEGFNDEINLSAIINPNERLTPF
jgi:hypothetical protein